MAASNPLRPQLSPLLSLLSLLKLTMDRAEFCANHLSTINKPYDKIVIGVVIVDLRTSKILLLRRAAHELYYPNVFELPSGNVDANDATLADALLREVLEETGLTVTSVVSELPVSFEYETTKFVQGVHVRKTCVQVNFIVEVADLGLDVTVNPDEHSVALWVGADELDGLEVTDGMRDIVRKAFELCNLSSTG